VQLNFSKSLSDIQTKEAATIKQGGKIGILPFDFRVNRWCHFRPPGEIFLQS